MDDPKRRMGLTPSEDTDDLKAQVSALSAQVQALMSQRVPSGGITAEQLQAVMTDVITLQAKAQADAMKAIAERDERDNRNYPRISVFSYPEGDKAHARTMPFPKIFWNGYDIDLDTTSAIELELLAHATPGEFRFKRLDGSEDTLWVRADRGPAGAIEKLHLTFDAKERRDTLPPMLDMLRYAFHVKSPQELELDALRQQVAAFTAVGSVPVGAVA